MPLPRSCLGIAIVLALIPLLLGARPSPAAGGVYTIERVGVDVTADSAAAAREEALAQGHVRAFRRLMERLVPRGRAGGLPEPSYRTIANFVRDFEVFDERTSTVRYLAELTFRFQPAAVRQFLRGRGVAFAETQSKPVVVLPLYGAAGEAALWSDANPWHQAWARREVRTGLVPFVVPIGDLADMRAVSAPEALNNDAAAFDRVAGHYDAGDVVVTQLIPAGDARTGTASAQIITSRIGTAMQERTFVDQLRQRQGESGEDMLARAVDMVAQAIEESWKRANLLHFEDEATLLVEVPLTGLDQWLEARRRLRAVPMVGEMRLRAITRELAELELVYYGDIEQLKLALAQSDLQLAEGGAAGWVLTASGGDGADAGGGDGTADASTTAGEEIEKRGSAEDDRGAGQDQSDDDGGNAPQ